jgi:hypothetical protein
MWRFQRITGLFERSPPTRTRSAHACLQRNGRYLCSGRAHDHQSLLEQHAECDEDEREDLLVIRAAVDIVAAEQRAPKKKKRGGSLPGKQPNLERDHAAGRARLMAKYFAPIPIYPAHKFRPRFRMFRRVFDRLLHGAVARDRYFAQKPDATGKMGLSPYQEVTAALRMYCYGVAADSVDECERIGSPLPRRVPTGCPGHHRGVWRRVPAPANRR